MPGPVSDSYDPEWGTAETADEIVGALQTMYERVSLILNDKEPIDIRRLAGMADKLTNQTLPMSLTEWEWRMIRFALERAIDHI